MNDRNDRRPHDARPDPDDDLRGLAMAAFDEHERSVTDGDTEAALAAVRDRIDAGGTGSVVSLTAERDQRRPLWLLLGSAAAVLVVVVGGLAFLTGGPDVGEGEGEGDAVSGLPPVTDVAEPGGDPVVGSTTSTAPTTTDPAPAVVPSTVPASTPATTTAPTTPPSTLAPSTTIAPVGGIEGDIGTSTDSEPESGPDDPVAPADAGRLAIPDRCVSDFVCTQLVNSEDGNIVAYDPTTETLSLWDATGRNLISETPLAESFAAQFPGLEHVGPDLVVYMSRLPDDAIDGRGEMLAIPIEGPNAGSAVMSWDDLSGDGDSSLVAQKAGLVYVPCCGAAEGPRPDPDAPIYRFVDRNGQIVQSNAVTFRLDLGIEGNNLARIDGNGVSTFFSLPSVLRFPRDIPDIVATDDGGALAVNYGVSSGDPSVVVDFDTAWPDFGIDNSDVYLLELPEDQGIVLLESSGNVVRRVDDGFARVGLDAVGTPGWPGRVETGVTNGVTTAPGLNDHIEANQPSWAVDLTLFAFQIDQSVGPNEKLDIRVDDATGVITLTTTGLLDDSVSATRRVVQTERADDGLLRFVSGTYSWRCVEGRGHQDFSVEPCI